MDLRHLAVILDAGKTAADNLQDAGLSAALNAMTEMAVWYAQHEGDDDGLFAINTAFASLARKHQ